MTTTHGEPVTRWTNHYHHDDCGTDWTDVWCCNCNDDCPDCGAEIEADDESEAGEVVWLPAGEICDVCGSTHEDAPDAEFCSECGAPLPEAGDGYDGKCAECADIEENARGDA